MHTTLPQTISGQPVVAKPLSPNIARSIKMRRAADQPPRTMARTVDRMTAGVIHPWPPDIASWPNSRKVRDKTIHLRALYTASLFPGANSSNPMIKDQGR